jgi:hypothetical protein
MFPGFPVREMFANFAKFANFNTFNMFSNFTWRPRLALWLLEQRWQA